MAAHRVVTTECLIHRPSAGVRAKPARCSNHKERACRCGCKEAPSFLATKTRCVGSQAPDAGIRVHQRWGIGSIPIGSTTPIRSCAVRGEFLGAVPPKPGPAVLILCVDVSYTAQLRTLAISCNRNKSAVGFAPLSDRRGDYRRGMSCGGVPLMPPHVGFGV